MKNYFRSSIKLKITGKNINRFINRLIHNNIDIKYIDKISNEEIEVIVYKKDIEKINNIKTIYELEEVNIYGLIKIKKIINKNIILIIFLIIGFSIIMLLSNVIFYVQVVYDKKEIQNLLLTELRNHGIDKYKFVKSFDEIEKIKSKILEKYKDKLEWIEIERVGIKYVIRVEERKIEEKKEVLNKQNIIVKKDCIIKKIEASNGVVLKNIDSFAKKGDVVVTGNIYLNDNLLNSIAARGVVYGEVWYKTKVEIPLIYNEKKYTSNVKKVLTIKFFKKSIELFNFKKYKDKQIEEKVLLNNPIIPLKITFDKQREIEVIDKIYTIDEAVEIARKKSINAIQDKLGKKEYIISSKDLKVDVKESKIVLEMFFSVYEDVTDYQEIKDIIE